MTRAASSDQRMLTLKAHYERVLKEMEEERQSLQVVHRPTRLYHTLRLAY